ncbi:MAG: erythromycin esterase family protein [Phycisphaerales bacterium]
MLHTIVLGIAAAATGQPSPAELAWVSRNAVPIETVEAGHGFKDLEPLSPIFQRARVVGLGESTHGTREDFQMKHRLVEFLASQLGYTIFSIEASSPEAFRVDEYVSLGKGDPARLIGGMYFWTWNTEEVLSMVEWMRAFNQDSTPGVNRIRFTGFDMQERRVSQSIVRQFIALAEPDFLPTLDADFADLESAGPAQAGFATSTGTLRAESARGKRVTLKGQIRTRNADGFAGLWMRVDGPELKPLAFDNMADRGPRGDSDWKEYSLTLDVPQEAANINFGFLMSGAGSAWFDACEITVGGAPYSAPDLDLSFDGPDITGLSRSADGYDISIDRQEHAAGTGALRLQSRDAGKPRTDPLAPAATVWDHLKKKRDAYTAAGRPAAEVDWAIHNAEIVHQWARMTRDGNRGTNARDEAMARNVLWLLEQNPDAKVVLWAHNMHMSTQPGFQGRFLRDALGDQYVSVGFAAGAGQYYAMPGPARQGFVHDLTPAAPDSVEALFEQAGFTIAALDLHKAEKKTAGSRWAFEPRTIRTIGALATDEQFGRYAMRDTFDVLIYIRDTTAARQLKTPPAPLGGRE